ncbi:unnamed protein product [Rhizopus stolonifer]
MVHYQVVFIVFFETTRNKRVRKTLIQPYTTHQTLYCISTDKQSNIAVSPCGPKLPVERNLNLLQVIDMDNFLDRHYFTRLFNINKFDILWWLIDNMYKFQNYQNQIKEKRKEKKNNILKNGLDLKKWFKLKTSVYCLVC